MNAQIVIGEIIKAQGIGGEIKVRPITNDASRFYKLRAAYIDAALYQICSVRLDKEFVYIKLSGVSSRLEAERLIGKFIKIERLYAVTPDDNEYFIAELIGCAFMVDGEEIGIISEVYQHGAADVIEVNLISGKTMMIPFLKSLDLKVDIKTKKVSAKAKDLKSVSVIN